MEGRLGLLASWRKVRWSVAQRGLWGTLRVGLGALGRGRGRQVEALHPFDARYGTATGGVIGGGRLGVGGRNDAHITAYAGVAPSRLNAALDRWAETLESGERLEDFAFVDLGCGKGRALLLASERPFREVVGVELNPALAEVARENVLIFEGNGRVRAGITVRCGDATDFAYPGGALLVFLYNPFGAPVVRAVLDALDRHVHATGARVDLIYQNEGPETPLRTDRRLRLLWAGPLAMSEEDAAADPVGSGEDLTALYRWVGKSEQD
jgi:SAM-dependent methyltransferase